MPLATKTINGNHSGPMGSPKVVIMHATRSTRADFTDAQELSATLSWFQNPNGASSHFVLSELERVRCVGDDRVAWHAAYLNEDAWGVEMTQPTPDRPFTDGHYANAALIGRHYVSLGVKPVWLSFWGGPGDTASGFVDHADTIQGRNSGKSDAGRLFDRVRFIDSLEDKMDDREFNERFLKAWETLQVTRDDRTSGSQELISYATPARIAQATQSHGSSSHGGGGSVTIPSVTVPVE